MSVQLIPTPLPELSRARFAFSPAIAGVSHNQWTLRRASWTELTATNTETAEELTIPRRWIAGIAECDPEPAAQTSLSARQAIVTLSQELEYSGGRVVPLRRGVIEMPPVASRTGNHRTEFRKFLHRHDENWKAPVVAIRVESESYSKVRRALRGSVALGFIACIALVFVAGDSQLGPDLGFVSPLATRELPFNAADNYRAIVNELGEPVSDRWIEAGDGNGYRRLSYTRQRFAVILEGADPDSARYVGAIDRRGRIVHAVAPQRLETFETFPGDQQ